MSEQELEDLMIKAARKVQPKVWWRIGMGALVAIVSAWSGVMAVGYANGNKDKVDALQSQQINALQTGMTDVHKDISDMRAENRENWSRFFDLMRKRG